jgi:HEAT repeat protein
MFGHKMNQVEKAIEKKHASTLIELCDKKDPEVCLAAIAGLGVVGGDDASNYLISRLQSTEPNVRLAVAHALGELGDMHTKAFVMAQMNKEENPDVRKALSKALSQIRSY